MIDTYFWNDPWIEDLGPTERYLFLYFLTNPNGNIAGIYEISDDRIRRETKLKGAAVQAALERFEKDGKLYRRGSWVILRNFPKRQNAKAPGVREGILRILVSLPEPIMQAAIDSAYQFPFMAEATARRVGGGSNQVGGLDEKDQPPSPSYLTIPNLTKPDLTKPDFDPIKHLALNSALEGIAKAALARQAEDKT